MSFVGCSKAKTREHCNISSDCSDVLYFTGSASKSTAHSRHTSHSSHYSAYSAVDSYTDSVKANTIKKIVKPKEVILKINEILAAVYFPYIYDNKVKCTVYDLEYTNLKSIDDVEINKRCYKLTIIREHNNGTSDSHAYDTYYIVENGDTYYRTEPYKSSGKINTLKWAKQILELIK